jgi:hypothetical protein
MFHDIKFRSLKNSRKIARKMLWQQCQTISLLADSSFKCDLFDPALGALHLSGQFVGTDVLFLGVLGGDLGAVGARSGCG